MSDDSEIDVLIDRLSEDEQAMLAGLPMELGSWIVSYAHQLVGLGLFEPDGIGWKKTPLGEKVAERIRLKHTPEISR